MIRVGLSALIICLSIVLMQEARAQFGIVSDTVTGIRQARLYATVGDRDVLDVLSNGSVVYLQSAEEDVSPFRYVEYAAFDNKNPRGGFLLETQVVDIRNLDLIDTERFSSHGYISFRNDSVHIVFTLKDFPKNDKFIEKKNDGTYRINNKKAIGIYKNYPEKFVQSIVVTINKSKTISVPKEMLENFFDVEMANVSVYQDLKTGIIYVLASENEKYTSYEAVWKVDKSGKCSVYWK